MKLLRSLLDLFFPPLCPGCSCVLEEADHVVCGQCAKSMPFTEHASHKDNKVSGLFTNISKVQRSAALCFYDPDTVFHKLVHALKYHNQPAVGMWLGRQAALRFRNENPHWFDGIDLILPVPLHRKRLGRRRYNQSVLIADGISEITGIPVDTAHLLRKVNNATQTLKSAEERRQNTQDIFSLLHPEQLKNKHVLLVDDVITTGSTMRSCINLLTPVRGLRISILAMGMAGEK